MHRDDAEAAMVDIMSIAKKDRELRALLAARDTRSFLPDGEIAPREEPDFLITTRAGTLGIEVSELMPLPRNSSFSSPIAEQRLHENVIQLAEREYYAKHGAIPVTVRAYFWNVEQGKNRKRQMAVSLVDFVESHCHDASPVATFSRRDLLPDGFSIISIDSLPRPWWSGESVPITLSDIRKQLAVTIEDKNKLFTRYRANLPGSPIWLLIYSGVEVSRGIPMPHGVSGWSFPFDFEHVFFYSSLSQAVEEIRRGSPDPSRLATNESRQ